MGSTFTAERFLHFCRQTWHTLQPLPRQYMDFTAHNGLCRALGLHRPMMFTTIVWPVVWGVAYGGTATGWAMLKMVILALCLQAVVHVYTRLTTPAETLYNKQESLQAPSVLVLILLLALLVGFCFVITGSVSPLATLWVLVWMMAVSVYPFVQKIVWTPQFYAAFIYGALPALMGCAAAGVGFASVMVALSAFCWSLLCATLQADAEKEADLQTGIRSIVVFLGSQSVSFLTGCLVATTGMLALTGLTGMADGFYFVPLMVAQGILFRSWYLSQPSQNTQGVASHNTLVATLWAGISITAGFILGL